MTFDPTSVEVTCVTLPKDHCVQVPWKYIKVCGYSDPFCKNLNQRSLTPRWPLTAHLLRSHVWLYQGSLCPSPMGIHQCMWIQWSILQITNRRSLTPRWPLTPHLLRSHVWLYPRIIVSKSHENTSKYVDTVTLFAKTWTKGHWPLDDLWPHICWGHMCDSTKDHCVQVPWEYINVCGYSDQFCKLLTEGHWPLDDLWPHICWGLMCDTTQRSLCPNASENTSKCVDTVTFFAKNLKQRSLTPRWPLTPHLLRSHVWLYPRIIVSKSHGNTSKYVDTVNLFAKTWAKGHWPLDDLWPHICWGHMCDSTKDHCVQVPWEYINVCGYSDQFCKLLTKGHWPLDDLWPHICWVLVWRYPMIIMSKSQWKYIKVCGYS